MKISLTKRFYPKRHINSAINGVSGSGAQIHVVSETEFNYTLLFEFFPADPKVKEQLVGSFLNRCLELVILEKSVH
jgi:hypothetical protein